MPSKGAELSFGAVVLVPFPFSDLSDLKKRPAVVVSSAAYSRARPDVIIMAVTSQMNPKLGFGDLTISQWQASGLLKPSAVKPVLATIEQRRVIRVLGKFAREDEARLRENLASLLR